MAVREAVLKEVVDRVFPALNLEWETHGEEIQTYELNRKNLGLLLNIGLESQQDDVLQKLIRDFYDALFPDRKSRTQ